MQKYKTKIIIAVVVVAALAGAWFLGSTPTVTVPETPFMVAAEAAEPTSLEETVVPLAGADAVHDSPQDVPSESESVSSDAGELENTPSAETYAHAEPFVAPDDPYTEAGAYADEPDGTDPPAANDDADNQPETSDTAEIPDAPPSEPDTQAEPVEAQETLPYEPIDTDAPSETPNYEEIEEADIAEDTASAIADDGSFTVTLSVRVDTILHNMHLLHRDKHELVPADGIIFPATQVTAYEGESVFNVLQREMRRNRIHMSSRFTPIFNSAYVEAINNLFEHDVGPLSGWMYSVNGVFPNFGSSLYTLSPDDIIEWVYTVDLGRDVGATWIEEFQGRE